MAPQPPSLPPQQQQQYNSSEISSHTRDVGQYFESFGPRTWKIGSMTFKPRSSRQIFNMDTIKFPILYQQDIQHIYDMIMESSADTYWVDRHTRVTECIQCVSISCRGFSDNLSFKYNLPLSNIIYA